MRDSKVEDLHLGAPEAGSGHTTGTWMYATVKSPAADGQAVPGMWEAELAQGALDELLPARDSENTAHAIVGSTIMLDAGSGTPIQIGGGAGDVVPGQSFRAQATGRTDAQITKTIDAILAQDDLSPLNITVLRPLGPAPSVIAQVADPNDLAGKFSELTTALNNGDYEGLYLEVRDGTSKALVRFASALRIGAGTTWFAPGMDTTLGILHPGLIDPNGSHPPTSVLPTTPSPAP